MTLDCVNDGGLTTIISIDHILAYEKAVELPLSVSAALQSWQLRPGDVFTMNDGQGDCWRVRLDAMDDEFIRVVPFARLPQPV